MGKHLQISIPTPCHEDWDTMTLVEKGRFCSSCQKKVIDFSKISDREIALFFKKPSTGSVCGRFMQDQLARDMEIPKKRIPWLKYFFQFLLPAFFITKAAGQQQKIGKIARPMVDSVKVPKNPKDPAIRGMVLPKIIPVCNDTNINQIQKVVRCKVVESPRRISGIVIDEAGSELPGASVLIKGKRTGVAADNKGRFEIRVHSGDILVVSGAGLETTEADIGIEKLITIQVNRVILGMVSVKKPRSIRKNIPLLIQELKDTVFKSFKIFPNPAKAGTEINIEWKSSESGAHILQLLNQAGQLIYTKELWIDEEAKALDIELPPMATGVHFIKMTNRETSKTFTEKIVIQ